MWKMPGDLCRGAKYIALSSSFAIFHLAPGIQMGMQMVMRSEGHSAPSMPGCEYSGLLACLSLTSNPSSPGGSSSGVVAQVLPFPSGVFPSLAP